MDLTKISTDSLRNICEFFLEEHLVTEEQLLQIATSRPSNEMKRVVDYIHSCLCKDDHDTTCAYMSEEQRAECWTMTSHREWLDRVANLMCTMQLSEAGLRNAFREAMVVLGDYSRLDSKAKAAFEMMLPT